MARFDPFSNVNCSRGAPMGRRGHHLDPDTPRNRLCARHQGGGGGYDKGGAYWGCPGNVWAVWERGNGPDTVTYVRAYARQTAIAVALGEVE